MEFGQWLISNQLGYKLHNGCFKLKKIKWFDQSGKFNNFSDVKIEF